MSASSIHPAEHLPVLPEQVTPAWLAEKLELKIKSVEETGAIHGTGSKLFYTLTLEDGDDPTRKSSESTLKLCVKGGFNQALRDQVP